jgi:tetratricopeptide (TPR) repeat protein
LAKKRSNPPARLLLTVILVLLLAGLALTFSNWSIRWSGSQSRIDISQTPPATTAREDTPTPTPSPTPTEPEPPPAEPGGPTVGVDAPDGGDEAITGRLIGALEDALSSAALSELMAVQEVTPPEGFSPADPTGDWLLDANISLLIAWEPVDRNTIRVYLLAPPTPPPLARLGNTPEPWVIRSPESTPFEMDTADDFSLISSLAAGLLELQAGDRQAALTRLRPLQSEESDISDAVSADDQAIGSFAVGLALADEGDRVGALQAFSRVLRLREDFPAARLNRGAMYLALGDQAAAQSAFDQLPSWANDWPPAIYNQALSSLSVGDLVDALAEANRAPDADWSANLRGIISYQQGNYAAALDDFRQAAAISGGDPASLFNQGLALQALGDTEEALLVFGDLLADEPDNPLYHLQRGLIYESAGRTAQAERAFTQAIALDPAYLDAYLDRAALSLSIGDDSSALADAEQILSLNPDEGRAYQIIGEARLAQEDYAAAGEAFSTALEKGLASAEVYAGRGWTAGCGCIVMAWRCSRLGATKTRWTCCWGRSTMGMKPRRPTRRWPWH